MQGPDQSGLGSTNGLRLVSVLLGLSGSSETASNRYPPKGFLVTFDTFGQLSISFTRMANRRGNESGDRATRFNALCSGLKALLKMSPPHKPKR